MRKLVGILAILVGALGLSAQEFSVFYIASANGTLTWCHCPEGPWGGLPRRASAVRESQRGYPNLLVLDAGDALAPFPSRLKDSVLVEGYKRIPLDAVAFGDQELMEGYDFFTSKMRPSLPYVCANAYRNASRILPAYVIEERGGLRIAITSVITADAFMFYETSYLEGIDIRDPSSELAALLPELSRQADVIILVSHLGLGKEREIASRHPEIDIIVSGHTPAYFPEPERVGSTFILGAGPDAQHFGVARFRFESDSIVLVSNIVKTLDDSYAEDAAILSIISPYIENGDIQIDSALIAIDTNISTFHSPVMIDVFYASDCDHCINMMKGFLPRLAVRHPGLFAVNKLHNIDDIDEFFLLEELEARFNDNDNDLPVLFFEGHVLGGEEEVKQGLEGLLLTLRPDYSSRDSARYTGQVLELHIDTSATLQDGPGGSREIVFFETYGCEECSRALYLIRGLMKSDTTLSLKVYTADEPESKELLAAFGMVYGLPEEQRLLTPVAFFGSGYLVKSAITSDNFRNLFSEQADTPIPWEEIADAREQAPAQIAEGFRSFGILPIIGAGLLDGINPCAFATLIFFITYLSVLGVERKRVIWVALPFILSVFLTYFILGIIAQQILTLLAGLQWVSRIIFGLTVIFLVVLAALTFYDFAMLKQGKGDKMKLKLSDRLRKRMNKMIRKRTAFGGLIAGAIVTGFFVSLFELVCTGQVYLPTLVYMVQVSEFKSKALLYLIVYNVAFIVPLVVVFILVRFGLTEKHLQRFLTRNAALTKILTAVLFLVLAGVMAYLLFKALL